MCLPDLTPVWQDLFHFDEKKFRALATAENHRQAFD
jgi:hypothetical protein